jgi:hypothetical protein
MHLDHRLILHREYPDYYQAGLGTLNSHGSVGARQAGNEPGIEQVLVQGIIHASFTVLRLLFSMTRRSSATLLLVN